MVSYKALYDDMRVALLMGKIGQACHYRSMVIREVTKRSILIEEGYAIQGLLEDYENLPGQ